MQNNKINVSELDFDNIKANLKDFLRGQDKFADFDFEGSSMSVLLDILAYNTHYNALYTNLATNESFLDSASKRSSVVSLAKSIGYIPDSVKSSEAYVDIIIRNPNTTTGIVTLPRYSILQTTVDGSTYNFYTLEDITTQYNSTDNTYTFSDVKIKEGTFLNFSYTVGSGQKYIIPNIDVDLSTLIVRVQETQSSSVFTSFNRQENLLNIGPNDAVYFLKEIEGELYELEFGNGIIGKALETGNIVNLIYMTTAAKDIANGAKVFSFQGDFLGATPLVVTKIAATGGYDKEGIDTIRYNAPRAFSSQNRGVTVNDYRSILLSEYGEAESVNVWGGEDNVPPVYGKVFIAIKPKNSTVLTEQQKQFVVSLLKSKNVVSITPEVVDPEYIEMAIETTAYYNERLTGKTVLQLQTLVTETILDYGDQYLESYDGIFRFSNFSSMIDRADPSIVSNISTIKLHRQVAPKYNIVANYNIELGNPIYYSGASEESIISSGFYVAGYTQVVYLEDSPLSNSMGTFKIYYLDVNNVKQYLPSTYGTINYKTGSILIENINIVGVFDPAFELIIKPQSNDVVSVRNQLVVINPQTVKVNIVVDKISSGDAGGNSNYIFSSSRN